MTKSQARGAIASLFGTAALGLQCIVKAGGDLLNEEMFAGSGLTFLAIGILAQHYPQLYQALWPESQRAAPPKSVRYIGVATQWSGILLILVGIIVYGFASWAGSPSAS